MIKKVKNTIEDGTTGLQFPVLDLPRHIVYDILARLPLKTIISCKRVSRTFRTIVEDRYFAEVYLAAAPSTTASIIVQEHCVHSEEYFHPYMLNVDEPRYSSPCSSDYHPYQQQYLFSETRGLAHRNVKCCFIIGNVTMINSCNGLLCLYSSQEPQYCICNPLSGECTTLPSLTPSTSNYTYLNQSGFGFCQKTNKYKVIRFMSLSLNSKPVAFVHTLGTKSWTNIGDAPCPKARGSFDPFVHGALHWISNSRKTSDLIFSFDLEDEKFRPIPSPGHFCRDYLSKISWISVGVRGECLCVCYTLGDSLFEVCTMKDYGVRESWVKDFVIDIKFYCGVRVEDFQKPIRFLINGELLLICNSNLLVAYSSRKGTFRDIKQLGHKAEAVAHVPSFITLENAVPGESLEVNRVKLNSTLLF